MRLYRDFATLEELDAQYRLDALCDVAAHVAAWERDSGRARAELEHRAGVHYGPTLDETLEVFPAARGTGGDDRPPPILVFIHGGYWRRFTGREFSFVARGLTAAGITTLVPTYALCPKVTVDEIVRQMRAAVAWAWRNAHEIGGDRDRIFVAGHSAGGHLTAMCLLTDWAGGYGLPRDVIKGGCAISGLFDLRPFPYTYLQPALQLDMAQVLRSSPQLLDLPEEAPPLLVTYGTAETPEFRRQSEDFLARWREHGLDGRSFPQPDRDHFTAIADLAERDGPLTREIVGLVEGRGG